MRKVGQLPAPLLRRLVLGIAGITSVLLLMSLLFPLKALTGTQVTLFGGALWLSGLLVGLWLERNGEPSPIGRTSNSLADSPSRPMTKPEQS
jgi:hypothetical protein